MLVQSLLQISILKMGFSVYAHCHLLSLVLTAALVHGCDLYQGSWVYDASYPQYDSANCPFIETVFNCLKNGRPDRQYLKYKWKPNACELPRFDGKDFLRKLEGKTVMFVGDSLSLNQWQSLTCMLHSAVPEAMYTLFRTGTISTFTFPDYNVKLKLVRNAFLVGTVQESIGRVLKLDFIPSGNLWLTADVLVFNSWHWWLHTGRKQPWKFIQEGNKVYKDIDRMVAYEKGLRTWAKWVDDNINTTSTKVFFQGVSPDHSTPQERLLNSSLYQGGQHPAEEVVKKVLSNMSKPVSLLDVTTLSRQRKDGHPAFYGYGGHRAMDCTHWCVAGVPDTWNQLLYASL